LKEYNVNRFDRDNNWTIDQTEEQNYLQELAKMLNHILKLQSSQKFQDIHEEVDWYWQTQINWYDGMGHLLAEYWIDEYLRPDITEYELSEMKERNFDFSSTDSWKEIWILIWNEAWESVKNILKMFSSSLSTVWLLWDGKYFSRFCDLLEQRASKDPNIAHEAAIKVEELMRTNPILWLVELFWEQWIEMIKNLWEMIQSWKQWDIATKITMIFWILSWAGSAKVVSKLKLSKNEFAPVSEVESPNEWIVPDNIEKIAIETSTEATKKVAEEITTQTVATGNQAVMKSASETKFSHESQLTKERIKAAESKSWISSDEVYENANLSDFDRWVKSEELLWRALSNEQKQVIIDIHNKSKWVYVERNAFWKDYDLNAMWNEAKTYFPDFSEFWLLVRYWILGKLNPHEFLLGKAWEQLTNNDILRLLETGNYNYWWSFSADIINNELTEYWFSKVSYETVQELNKIHSNNVSISETKSWFQSQSFSDLDQATNNPEINDLLIKFKQKPSSLTAEETQLVLHIWEQVRWGNLQLIFNSKAEAEELKNRFTQKEIKTQEESIPVVENTTERREEVISLSQVNNSSVPEKKNIDISKLDANALMRWINSWDIDINALEKDKLELLQNKVYLKISNFPIDEQIKILDTWNVWLLNEKYLDRLFHSTVLNANTKQLENIKWFILPEGRLLSLVEKYESFDVKEIISILDKLIKRQK
jgi:hypothetical protein